MEVKSDLFRLVHIQNCIDKILALTKLLHHVENFERQWIEQDAMIRNFEIIGEASNHISETTKQKYPQIEWNEIRGMRNFITHEYFGVDLSSIWETAINDIPRLKVQINQIITALEEI